MEDNDRVAATLDEELDEVEPGSESEDDLSGEAADSEESDGGTNLNEKAYKGLQRRLSAKDRELNELRRQYEELQSRNQSGDLTIEEVIRLVKPVIDQIKVDNPELARSMAQNIAATIDARQSQSAVEELQKYKEREKRQAEDAAVVAELREVASDLGVDPDHPDLDYGDSTQSWRERLALVRQTAKELARPARPNRPRPKPTEAVNDRGGTPPNPRKREVNYTNADLQRELAAYRDTRKREHLEKANEIRAHLVSAAEKTLTS